MRKFGADSSIGFKINQQWFNIILACTLRSVSMLKNFHKYGILEFVHQS